MARVWGYRLLLWPVNLLIAATAWWWYELWLRPYVEARLRVAVEGLFGLLIAAVYVKARWLDVWLARQIAFGGT